MRRRYVYMNIVLTLTALILPCPFLKFGNYADVRYVSIADSETIIPSYKYTVPQSVELEKYMIEFTRNYSYFSTLYEIGRSGHDISKSSFPIYDMVLSSGYAKPIIVFIGGIYASDLRSPQTLAYCFTEWITNTKTLAQLLPLYDYHFIPLINPEGYEFVYQKRQNGVFFRWLKNMRGFGGGRAVNILNNFDSHFGAFPKKKTDEHFGGKVPFSEKESKIIRDYIMTIRNNIAAVFLLFSSTGKDAITYPYAHTMEEHDSWILQEQLAIQAIRSVHKIWNTSISVMSTFEYEGLAAGRMDDWLKENLQNRVVLNIQMDFSLKDADNGNTLRDLNTKVEKLLKGLVVGLYRDKYLRYQATWKGSQGEMYKFPWRNIGS